MYGQYKIRTIRQACLLVCGRMSFLFFVQRTFDWRGEIVLVVEESVETGRQLPPAPSASMLKKPLISRQTLGYYSTLDLIQTFE